MNTKNIVIITDAWHPQTNGVVTVFSKIIFHLKQEGVACTIIHPGLFRTVPLPLYQDIRLALFPRKHLLKLIQETRPDAIHIATEGPLGMSARAICRERNIPYTTSYHTQFHLYIEMYTRRILSAQFVLRLLRRFHRGAAATMVATEGLKQELEAQGFTNLVVWTLGVDTNLFARNPHPPLPSLEKPVCAYFGRVAQEKNVEEFLAASLPGSKIVIGDGPELNRLEKKYGQTVRFVGRKTGQELVDWLSLCDVVVFTSRMDTFGLTIIESLACGVPVVAHDCLGPRDIITSGKDGILTDNIPAGVARALTLSHEACRQTALQYTWEHSAGVFLKNLHFIHFPTE